MDRNKTAVEQLGFNVSDEELDANLDMVHQFLKDNEDTINSMLTVIILSTDPKIALSAMLSDDTKRAITNILSTGVEIGYLKAKHDMNIDRLNTLWKE